MGEESIKSNILNWTEIAKTSVSKLDPSQIVDLANTIIKGSSNLKTMKEDYLHQKEEMKISFKHEIEKLNTENEAKIKFFKEEGRQFLEELQKHEETYRFFIEKQYEFARENLNFAKIALKSEKDNNLRKEIIFKIIDKNTEFIELLGEINKKTLDALPSRSEVE